MKNDFYGNNDLFANQSEGMVKSKRKVGADVILLIFLCLLVLLTLTTLTFLKFGSEQVLTGEMAFAEEAATGEQLFNVEVASTDSSMSFSVEEDGTSVMLTKEEEKEIFTPELFTALEYCVDFRQDLDTNYVYIDYLAYDDDGNQILDSLGEPVILHYSEYFAPGSFVGTECNMDEILGLDGTETEEQVAEKFYDYTAKNAAYADNSTSWSPGGTSQYSQNTQYQAGSTISASNSSSGGNGSGCSTSTCCFCAVGGSQWTRWWNNSVIQGRATYSTGGGGSSYQGCWTRVGWMGGPSYGSSNSGGTGWTNRSGSTMRYYVCAYASSGSTGSCSGSNVNVHANSCTFYMRHTNGDAISTSLSYTKSWATYRPTNNITFSATSSIDFIIYIRLAYSINESSDNWAWSTTGGVDNNYNWNRASASRVNNTNNCLSRLYYYVNDYGAHSREVYTPGSTLYIDRYAPECAGGFWIATSDGGGGNVQEGGSSQSAAVFNVASMTTPLYMFSACRDVGAWAVDGGYRSGVSGVNLMYATNNQTGQTVNFTKIWVYTGDYYWWRGQIQAQDAVGYWTVYAKDNAGNVRTYTSYWCSSVDCAAPEYNSNFSYDYAGSKSAAGDYWTVDSAATTWASAPLKCTMSFKDKIGSRMHSSSNIANIYQRNGIARATVTFFYNGKQYYLYSNGSTSSNNATNAYCNISMSDTGQGGWGGTGAAYKTCTLTFYLPFSVNCIYTNSNKSQNGFVVTAYDHAGHSVSTTITNQTYKIDTVAPKVTSVTLNKGTSASAYTNGDITLTVKAQDYNYDSTQVSGFAPCTNGSGIQKIFVYTVNPQSNRSAAPLAVATVENAAVGNTSEKQAKFTINKDSFNIAGNVNNAPTLYIVAQDYAGNRSDAYNGYNNTSYSANKTHNNVGYKTVNNWGNLSPYYYSPNTVSTINAYRDTYGPYIQIFEWLDNTWNIRSSSNGSSGTSNYYVLKWEQANEKKLLVRVYCGSSGGNLTWTGKGGSDTITPATITNNKYPVSHYQGSGRSYTVSGNTAYSYVDFTVIIKTQGNREQAFTFAGGSGNNTSTVRLTTRLDTTAPEVQLLGFRNSYSNTDSYFSSTSYTKTEDQLRSAWFNDQSLYAIFKATDSYSGMSSISDTSSQQKKYGKDGTALTQNTLTNHEFKFSYSYTDDDGKTHVYNKTLSSGLMTRTVSGATYVALPIFRSEPLQTIVDSGTSSHKGSAFYNSTTGVFDTKVNTFLRYSFTVKDFIGNVGTCMSSNCLDPNNSRDTDLRKVSASTSNLVYASDPFTMNVSINMQTVTEDKFNKVTISNIKKNDSNYNNIDGAGKPYNGSKWTRDYVIVVINITPTLSKPETSLGWREMDSTGAYNYSSLAGLNPAEPDSYYEHWMVLKSNTRKINVAITCRNLAGTGRQFSTRAAEIGENGDQPINIKQDATPPTPLAVFFSTVETINDIGSDNIEVYFDYSNGFFRFNADRSHIDTGLIQLYGSGNTLRQIYFTDKKVYMYLLITDYNGGMEGSGVWKEDYSAVDQLSSKVKVTATGDIGFDAVKKYEANTISIGGSNFQGNSAIYRSRSTFGFTKLTDATVYGFELIDHVGNPTSSYSTAIDKENARNDSYKMQMVPVIDNVSPVVVLKKTDDLNIVYLDEDGNVNKETRSYTYTDPYNSGYYFRQEGDASIEKTDGDNGVVRLTGTTLSAMRDEDGNPMYDVNEKPLLEVTTVNGAVLTYSVKADSITLHLSTSYGLSGYDLYLRQRSFNQPISEYERGDKHLEIEKTGNRIPNGYKYIEKGWGSFDSNGIWQTDGQPLSITTGETGFDNDIEYTIPGGSLHQRFDILIVGKTGLYYLFELGDINVDKNTPTLLEDMTFYTVYQGVDDNEVASYNETTTIDYENLTNRIWSNTIDSDYTNSKVYAYYSLYDMSGVDSVGKKASGNDRVVSQWIKTINNETVVIHIVEFEQVKVRVPLVHIDGNPTDILWIDDVYGDFLSSKCTISESDGYYAVTIDGKKRVTRMVYKSNRSDPTVEKKYKEVTYYRYLTDAAGFTFYARDTLDNDNLESGWGPYKPKIDTTDVSVGQIIMKNYKPISPYYISETGDTCSVNDYELKTDEEKANWTYVEPPDYIESSSLIEIYNTQSSGQEKVVYSNYDYYSNDNDDIQYSRSKVDVSFSLFYGASGFGVLTIVYNGVTYEIATPQPYKNDANVWLKLYENGKSVITSVNTGKSFKSDGSTAISIIKQVDNKYYWKVNNDATTLIVNQNYYGKPIQSNIGNFLEFWNETGLTLTFNNNSTVVAFSVDKDECADVFTVSFKNGIKKPAVYDKEGSYPYSTKVDNRVYDDSLDDSGNIRDPRHEYRVYIDRVDPVIDKTSGNFGDFGSYVSIAKLLRVSISDGEYGSGIAMDESTNNALENVTISSYKGPQYDNEGLFIPYYSEVEDENSNITITKNYDESHNYWMIKNLKENGKDPDGLYRPVSVNTSNYTVTGFVYCVDDVYIITVYDKAGNRTQETLYVKIDEKKPEFDGDLKYFTGSGEMAAYDSSKDWTEYDPGENWTTYMTESWTGESVLIVGKATYGVSGYVLQHYNDSTGTWEDLSTGMNPLYKLTVLDGGADNSGYVVFSLWITREDIDGIANRHLVVYEDYKLRVISKAQRNDIKSIQEEDKLKEEGTVTTDEATSTYYGSQEEFVKDGDKVTYDNNDKNYVYKAGSKKLQIAGTITSKLRIDKVDPDIEINVSTAGIDQNGQADGLNDNGDYVWTFGNEYVSGAVTVRIVAVQADGSKSKIDFASGTEYYYTADMNATKQDTAKWTYVKYDGNGFYSFSSSDGKGSTKIMDGIQNAITKVFYANEGVYEYKITGDQQGSTYKFYVKSGAGKESRIYRVEQVKIDTKKPNVGLSAVDSYTNIAENGKQLIDLVTEEDFNTYRGNSSADYDGSTTWTKKNSVIYKVDVSNIGFSGAVLNVNGEEIEISYSDFMSKRVGNYATFYYGFKGNGEQTVAAEITSNASTYTLGQQIFNKSAANNSVKIDNTTPFIIVKEISGTKAGNWRYADDNDRWYVDNFAITLKVGIVENVDGTYVYKDQVPYSGYKIYYARSAYYENGELVTVDPDKYTWTSIPSSIMNVNENEKTLTFDGLYRNTEYKFKVVSNNGTLVRNGETLQESGMDYVIGDAVYNNAKMKQRIQQVVFGSETLTLDETATRLHQRLNGVKEHRLNGDTSGNSFMYLFNIDTNEYVFDYNASIYIGKDENNKDLINDNKSDLVVETKSKGNWANKEGGTFSAINANSNLTFKHGDIIKIEYTSKSGVYNYYHLATKLDDWNYNDKNEKVYSDSRSITNDGVKVKEANGYFTFVFNGYNVSINAKFGAEIPVVYSGTDFYIQYNETENTVPTGVATYSWEYVDASDNMKTRTEPVALKYNYYVLGVNGNRKDFTKTLATSTKTDRTVYDIGAYYVVPRIDLYDVYSGYSTGDRVSYAGKDLYIYNAVKNAYELTTHEYFRSDTVYYYRNDIGDFRVKIHDESDEERQEFTVKYFVEKDGYYELNSTDDIYYIDREYYHYDPSTDLIEKRSYLKDTGANGYKLTTDLIVNVDNTIKGKFEARFDGNNKNLFLNFKTLNSSYGFFKEFAGTLCNLSVSMYKQNDNDDNTLQINLQGNDDINIGLIAQTITAGSIYNVSVVADILVTQSGNRLFANSYIGGVAAKASDYSLTTDITFGKGDQTLFTDVRIKNNGSALRRAYIGGMFGYIVNVDFVNAIAFGDITVYNVDSSTTRVGMVSPMGSINSHSGLYYLANNTFFNDEMIQVAGNSFGGSIGTAVSYDNMISTEVGTEYKGSVDIVGSTVRSLILDRLHKDFYGSTEGEYKDGSQNRPLEISTVEQLAMINEYVNLNYQLVCDIDVSGYVPTAVHKSFNGSINGASEEKNYFALSGFGGSVSTCTDQYFGFFGQLRGTVKNIVFTDIDVNIDYTGSKTFYAGIVAGMAYDNSNINNVILVGSTVISTTSSSEIDAGGIVGSGSNMELYDILSINNVKVTATNMSVGGFIGSANKVSLGEKGRVYALGRVEAKSYYATARAKAGALIGSATGNNSANGLNNYVFVLNDNTYVLGQVVQAMVGQGNITGLKTWADFSDTNGMRSTQFTNGLKPFDLLFSDNTGWYPLLGKGTKDEPFKVRNESEFKKIELALFAAYQIMEDITFTSFKTIGDGLNFTGSIDGGSGESISAEESTIVSLKNITEPLIYNIMGEVQNLSINIEYEHTIKSGETLYFGVVAVKLTEGGNVRNVTIGGNATITGATRSTTAYVSGFVSVISGGSIDNSSQKTKVKNNISALNITVKNVGTVYVGGYAAMVERGGADFSFGISRGNITLEDCGTTVAGYLVGLAYGECAWDLPLSSDYFYDFEYIVNRNGVRIVTTNPGGKPEEDDRNKEKKLIGRKN